MPSLPSVKKHSQVERRKPTIARSEQQLQRFTDPTWNRHLSHVLDPHKAYKRENWMISSSETGNPENQFNFGFCGVGKSKTKKQRRRSVKKNGAKVKGKNTQLLYDFFIKPAIRKINVRIYTNPRVFLQLFTSLSLGTFHHSLSLSLSNITMRKNSHTLCQIFCI
ncbi:hypothetical protein DVH24_025399 [Malus domestica]|uniref:Uncharacterized protein n=1 Tax=Malus domestica TaxID=3750 RepID=A0A498HK52_MALDO|nr:hypothetical protein DVH24_025399 [Malus domestica]